jgi:zinc transport system substrate-binding protein
MSVATTTSLLGSIVKAIGKNHISVTTIVPAGMCPGHFDVTTQNIKNVADSKILFNHGWEKWIDKLLAAVERRPNLYTIDVSGNVMVPPIHKKTAHYVATILCSLDRAHQKQYMDNLNSYIRAIDSLIAIMEKEKAKFARVKVACSELQEEFAQWLGFNIVISYPRAEDLSPKTLEQVVFQSRQKKVVLVIDNMQSGTDAGRTIAQEINAPHVILTNFPLHGTYLDAIMGNFQKLLQAVQ